MEYKDLKEYVVYNKETNKLGIVLGLDGVIIIEIENENSLIGIKEDWKKSLNIIGEL